MKWRLFYDNYKKVLAFFEKIVYKIVLNIKKGMLGVWADRLSFEKKREFKMAVPKKKTSKSKKNMRRSHHALSVNTNGQCPKCGELVRPHHVCDSCGHYNKKDIVVKADAE